MSLVTLAERLHITIAEAEEMSLNEFNEWVAYFAIAQERAENASK